jgi:hypothetical protein
MQILHGNMQANKVLRNSLPGLDVKTYTTDGQPFWNMKITF